MLRNGMEHRNEYEYDLISGVMKIIRISYRYYESLNEIVKWINYKNFNGKSVIT